ECGEHHSPAAAGHAPGDLLAEPPLGLLGDLDAPLPGLLAEAADEPVDERRALLVVHVARRVGQRADDRDLLTVPDDLRGAGEPALGEPSGEPSAHLRGDVLACHVINITQLRGKSTPSFANV